MFRVKFKNTEMFRGDFACTLGFFIKMPHDLMLILKIAILVSKQLLKITTLTSEELTGKATKKKLKTQ